MDMDFMGMMGDPNEMASMAENMMRDPAFLQVLYVCMYVCMYIYIYDLCSYIFIWLFACMRLRFC